MRALELDLTPLNCAQIRKGLRLSVRNLAAVLAVYPKTVDNWERRQRTWSSGLAGDFMSALGFAMCIVGPEVAWGPPWLSRRQRLAWILRAAVSAGGDSCMGAVPVAPTSLAALQPQERIRYRRLGHKDRVLEVEQDTPDPRLCLRVRRRLGLQMKELGALLAVSDNTVAAWERGQPLHGLELDVYEALQGALQHHSRTAAWGPTELGRQQRLLHVLQLGLAADRHTCAAAPPALCVLPRLPTALRESWLRVGVGRDEPTMQGEGRA